MAKDHIVMFPFMAKGHTIPLLHLATALSARFGLRVTFITTPANAPFIRRSLPADRHPDVHLITLPFPHSPPLPSGCESTDHLPSFDLYPAFLSATSHLRQPFDAVLTRLLRSSPPPLCLISDFFFGWTLQTCRRLGLPRVVFHGMSAFSMALCKSLWVHLPELDIDSGAPFHVPGTPPALMLTRRDVPDTVLASTDKLSPLTRFLAGVGEADVNSWGVIVNSFACIEGDYVARLESMYTGGARAWLVGPLCLFSDGLSSADDCIRWLDEQAPGSVVYVSFGTQAEVTDKQLDEIAHGLAASGCGFLWAVRPSSGGKWSPPDGVLNGKGRIVGWSPQTAVLNHAATAGFISHCGWNSVLEAVSAGVPVLAWPMIAEQHLNARLVVDELEAGIEMEGSEGGDRMGEVVGRREVREGVRELMVIEGEEINRKGARAREKAAELRQRAKLAVTDGGSSHKSLEELIETLRGYRSSEGDGNLFHDESMEEDEGKAAVAVAEVEAQPECRGAI